MLRGGALGFPHSQPAWCGHAVAWRLGWRLAGASLTRQHQLEFDSLAPGGNRKPVTVKGETGKQETLPLYTANDCVRGQVHLTPAAGKKVEHQGIKVELLGTIELFFDRGNTYDFVQMGAHPPRLCLSHHRVLTRRRQPATWSPLVSSPQHVPTSSSSTTWRCPTSLTTA